jgi:hypothetical protein
MEGFCSGLAQPQILIQSPWWLVQLDSWSMEVAVLVF